MALRGAAALADLAATASVARLTRALEAQADPVAVAERLAALLPDNPAARDRVARALRLILDARARVPEDQDGIVPEAPARGAYRLFEPVRAYPKGADDTHFKPTGTRTMVMADVFDRMQVRAARRAERARAGRGAEDGAARLGCGLTPSQIAMGRTYRGLAELADAQAGPRSCLDVGVGSGGGVDGGIAGAAADVSRRLRMVRARIGSGPALEVRRRTDRPRGMIGLRFLVDQVCLADREVSEVARSCGWVDLRGKVDTVTLRKLTVALAAALDRMQGPMRRGGGHFRTDLPGGFPLAEQGRSAPESAAEGDEGP